jgi:hypothetical protein
MSPRRSIPRRTIRVAFTAPELLVIPAPEEASVFQELRDPRDLLRLAQRSPSVQRRYATIDGSQYTLLQAKHDFRVHGYDKP